MECGTIPLIDTLDQPSVDTQSTLHQDLSQQSVDYRPLLIKCQSSINQVLIEMSRSRVLIDTHLWMPDPRLLRTLTCKYFEYFCYIQMQVSKLLPEIQKVMKKIKFSCSIWDELTIQTVKINSLFL